MNKTILDACCGSRMFWFDQENPNAVFMDNRILETELCDGRKLVIAPDVVGDTPRHRHPGNHTRIPWRGKAETDCPDAPRYKACGNSFCVNVIRWLGERIAMVDELTKEAK